jgi:hypothetical protein
MAATPLKDDDSGFKFPVMPHLAKKRTNLQAKGTRSIPAGSSLDVSLFPVFYFQNPAFYAI